MRKENKEEDKMDYINNRNNSNMYEDNYSDFDDSKHKSNSIKADFLL